VPPFQDYLLSKLNMKANSDGIAKEKKAEDGLAKEGHRLSSECVALERIPPCVLDMLRNDCSQNWCVLN
jgi:hypothetical protein